MYRFIYHILSCLMRKTGVRREDAPRFCILAHNRPYFEHEMVEWYNVSVL